MLLKLNISKPSAYWLYLFIMGTQSLALATVYTVNMVYQVTQVGLNPLQLILVGTALELTIFLFEIPTGVVADVYSRRLSVIIGYALLAVGILIEGSIPVFEALLFSAVVAGLGYTFMSGATSAWLVDEIGQKRAADAFLRASQVSQIMAFVGICLSVTLASIGLQLAIISGGFLMIGLVLVMILLMPEDGFERVPKSERESWTDLFATLREGIKMVRGRQTLIAILLIAVIYGAFTEGYDRLWTAHILAEFTLPSLGALDEIVWFAIIRLVSMPITLIATEIVRRRVDMSNSRTIAQILSIVYTSMIASVLLFALGGQFWLMLIGLWITNSLRSVSYPLVEAWINGNTESKVRATVLSIAGQSDAFGQIAGGPAVGVIGTIGSIRMALSASAIMLMPIILVFRQTLKRDDIQDV